MEWATVEGTGESVAGTGRVGDLWVDSYPISWDFRACLVHVDNKGPVNVLLPGVAFKQLKMLNIALKPFLHAIVTQGAPSLSFPVSFCPISFSPSDMAWRQRTHDLRLSPKLVKIRWGHCFP